jgi:hypothetical protein
MPRILKANTAVRIVVGPLCDLTTGLAKTGMTVTNMAMYMWHEHDDGSAPTKTIDAVAFTASGGNNDMVELAGGYYDIEITAAQTDITAGRCKFLLYDIDVILPYFEDWIIVPANVFDSIMGTDLLQIDVTQLLGTAWLAPGVAGTPDVNTKLVGGTVQTARDLGLALTALPAAILDLTDGIETGLTPRNALRLIAAALSGKLSGAATASVKIKNAIADDKTRITASVDADGNRTAITTDLT